MAARAPAWAAPWLFVSDIHLDPGARQHEPVHASGLDSNLALFDSALAEMQRVDPDPPVVVIGGDELAHNFNWSQAGTTMAYIARRFDRAFPRAQFVMTMGNEDSSCGDYRVAAHSTFLRDVARAWEPLVNRHGAAPRFAQTFARDGFYVARLPVARLQAVVIDDVFWSPRYRACGSAGDRSAQMIAELNHALHASADRHWIVMHIPPGIDAFSTVHLARGLVIVPFLNPGPRAALEELLADPRTNVALAIAAHTHKFAYRIAGTSDRPVPMVLLPSISPIFGNAPGFLTANVDPDGALRGVESYAYDGHDWRELGGFRRLGVERVTGATLVDLQARLARDATLRERFGALYQGGNASEIDEHNWPQYWCAATMFSASAFRTCSHAGGTSLFTSRGIAVFATVAAVAAAAIIALAFLGVRRFARRRT